MERGNIKRRYIFNVLIIRVTSLKIISYNVNGIRAAMKKGLISWLAAVDADIVCLQEVRASIDQFKEQEFIDLGYHCYWFEASKKGYSGVAILSKTLPESVKNGIGVEEYDLEARLMTADYKNFSVISSYHPSGASNPARQVFKLNWLEDFTDFVKEYGKNRNLILAGDFNVCHQPIDIHNPMANQHSPGFTPEERTWFTNLLGIGYVDAFRSQNPQPHEYTWFSYISRARERNLGWRIDYHIISENLEKKIERCVILKEARHSDHCPVLLEIS